VSKSDIESLKRSIEYRIKESKITRKLLATTSSSTDLNKILKDALIDLQKTTLAKFKDFDDQLKNDFDLIKNLVSIFLLLSIKQYLNLLKYTINISIQTM